MMSTHEYEDDGVELILNKKVNKNLLLLILIKNSQKIIYFNAFCIYFIDVPH